MVLLISVRIFAYSFKFSNSLFFQLGLRSAPSLGCFVFRFFSISTFPTREIAVPGIPGGGPPPLRSKHFPLGFPDLQERLPREFQQVRAANTVYRVVASCICELLRRKIAWSLENQANSILWDIPFIRDIISQSKVAEVRFQHCMYGGDRDK